MDKKRKILIGLIILDVIIFGVAIVLTIKLINAKDNENDMQNVIENKIENVIENTNTNVNDIENVVEPEEEKEEKQEKQITADPTQEVEENVIEEQKSNEEKAINIAKEKWGNDSTVEFTFDHIDEKGRYVVFIRNIETTRQIDAYVIDVETGKVVQ